MTESQPHDTDTGPLPARGPLGAVLSSRRRQLYWNDRRIDKHANALLLLRRVAFPDRKAEDGTDDGESTLLNWATKHHLGHDKDLLRDLARRRDQAIEQLCLAESLDHRRIRVRPEWRMVVGLGERANPYEIGMSLHGTYGVPAIPGSTVKGLTRAWAEESGAAEHDPDRYAAVFGAPPADGSPGSIGRVTFLDALPDGKLQVAVDVVTPHVRPYYDSTRQAVTEEVTTQVRPHGNPPAPEAPAEHHQPVPARFLVVEAGSFTIDLVGPGEHLAAVAEWCATAVDELGVGAKTSAGYGYLTQHDGGEA